jgi:hypothetical protein
MTLLRRALAAAGWCAALAAAHAVLRASGSGALAAPAGDLRSWLAGHDPAVAAMAFIRLGAVAGWWYMAGVTGLGVLSRVSGLPAAVRATDRFTVAPVRRLLHASLGAGVVVASLAAPAAADPGPRRDVPVIRRLDGPAGHSEPAPEPAPPEPAPPEPIVTQPAPPPETPAPDPHAAPQPEAGTQPVASETPPPPAPVPAEAEAEAAAAPLPATTHLVQPGESFWRIAHATLAAAHQRPPTAAEVAPYWRALIVANRTRLHNPDNPDLLFTGQQLDLPPIPTPTGHGIP